MTTTVCTLFEGRHQIGAAALLNSLHRSGFHGHVVCGYRGELPRWAESVAALDPIQVHFRHVDRPEHLTYLKPWFLRAEWGRRPDTARIAYLDPDVVVKCRWDFVETWMDGGIAAVQDVNGRLPANHPLRTQWRLWLEKQGLEVAVPRAVYVNAGFLGLDRAFADLLETWWDIVQRSAEVTGGLGSLKHGRPNDLFYSADQDALNIALELVTHTLSWVGGEGMDFAPGGSLLSHAIGLTKPWDRKALRRALGGSPPGLAHGAFLEHADGPLRALSGADLRRLVIDFRAAKAVARVWRGA